MKLAEASKIFGKKFASGASITKNPMEKDQIEVSLIPEILQLCQEAGNSRFYFPVGSDASNSSQLSMCRSP